MKTIRVIRSFWQLLMLQFKRDLLIQKQKNKYQGLGVDIKYNYKTEHPDATDRMVRKHVTRELNKIAKKDKDFKN